MTRFALTGILLALVTGSLSCSGKGSSPQLPTTPTVITPTSPAPVPSRSGATGVALFGTVFEATPSGQSPVPGVLLYCDACGEFGHTFQTTDANGSYRFSGDLEHGGGVWLGWPMQLLVEKAGYKLPGGVPVNSSSYPEAFWLPVKMNGDTQVDITLARQ